jgi:pilus assembly protein CpaE
MHLLSVALVVADYELRNEVRTCLDGLPVRVVLDQPRVIEWSTFQGQLKRLTPDLLFIDAPQFHDPFDGVAERIKTVPCPPSVAVVHPTADSETILRALRAGASEFVHPPLDQGVGKAVEHVCQQRAEQEAAGRPVGRLIGYLSSKGGCGATTIACHVAVGLQQATKHDILLADLDVEAGIVGLVMKASTPYSILDAARVVNRLDAGYWRGLVGSVQPRLDVIPAPCKRPSKEPVAPQQVRDVLRFLRLQYGWVVADLGRSLNFFSRVLLDEFDEVFLVSTPDVPALFQTKHIVQSLLRSSYSDQRLRLILNRVSKRTEFTRREALDLLGVPIYAELPDRPELEAACAEGRLVAAESVSGKHLMELAMRVANAQVVEVTDGYSILGLKKVAPGWLRV